MCGCGCDLVRAQCDTTSGNAQSCDCVTAPAARGELRPCCAASQRGFFARLRACFGSIVRLGRADVDIATRTHRSAET